MGATVSERENPFQSIMDLLINPILDLKVLSWRQFLFGVNHEGSDCVIEVWCSLVPRESVLESDILVEGTNESLHNLEFRLEIHGQPDATPNSEPAARSAAGLLRYNPPIRADDLAGLPSSVIEKKCKCGIGDRSRFIRQGRAARNI
jgi:hypothetical protein